MVSAFAPNSAADTRRFHLYAQYAVFPSRRTFRRPENRNRSAENSLHARVWPSAFCRVNRVTHHVEVSDSREVSDLLNGYVVHFESRAGNHTDHFITSRSLTSMRTKRRRSRRANDFLHAGKRRSRLGIDGQDGMATHTVAHHGDLTAFVSPGDLTCRKRCSLRGHLRGKPQCASHRKWVAPASIRHSEITHFCITAWSCHLQFPFKF